jgi:hypothetical protein
MPSCFENPDKTDVRRTLVSTSSNSKGLTEAKFSTVKVSPSIKVSVILLQPKNCVVVLDV